MPESPTRPVRREDPEGPAVPVVFDSPHSGQDYPEDFRPAAPLEKIRQSEDTYVDELYAAAPAHGAVLAAATFPRSYIDPNRDVLDLDPELIDGEWPGEIRPGDKSRRGTGLIWRQLPWGQVDIYDRRLGVAEVQHRIENYWHPYHEVVSGALEEMHGRFGAVWHVNCHSMPAMGDASMGDVGRRRADFVLGDRDGTTCEPAFSRLVSETLTGLGYSVAMNDPFKGVELVRRYADPKNGRHSLQIEINRDLYMIEGSYERAAQFNSFRDDITKLIQVICAYASAQTLG